MGIIRNKTEQCIKFLYEDDSGKDSYYIIYDYALGTPSISFNKKGSEETFTIGADVISEAVSFLMEKNLINIPIHGGRFGFDPNIFDNGSLATNGDVLAPTVIEDSAPLNVENKNIPEVFPQSNQIESFEIASNNVSERVSVNDVNNKDFTESKVPEKMVIETSDEPIIERPVKKSGQQIPFNSQKKINRVN